MRFEGDSRQPVAPTREGYPTAIHQHCATVRALQGSQDLVSRATLITSIIQQKLMIGIQVASHGDSLETLYLIDTARSQRNDLLCAGRESIVLSLPQLASSPLPAPQVEKRHTQDNCQDSENPGRSKHSGADRNPDRHAIRQGSINRHTWK